MNIRPDIVVARDGETIIFTGTTEETVKWLEEHITFDARWVYIGESADIITESQYLDLAS